MEYLKRSLTEELEKWLTRREIIAIKGPRQSGKTTMLKILKEHLITKAKIDADNVIYITFEDRDLLEAFARDPKNYINAYLLKAPQKRFYFLIDEFQYLKDGGQKLKLLYDTYENAKFIITGSSSLEITEHTAKYLVGRVFSFYLYQFSFKEYLQAQAPQHIQNAYEDISGKIDGFLYEGKNFSVKEDLFAKDFLRYFEDYVIFGGYPESVKSKDIETKKMVLKNIYDTYITKDIVGLLRIKDISGFRVVVSMLANQIGNLLNMCTLAADSGSYFRQLKQYLSILEETYITRYLRPYFKNKTTELKKNPKPYFVDTGLRNWTINNFNRLEIRPDAGALIENVILSGFYQKGSEEMRYWRTLGQAEVDFVLKQADELLALEVKYSSMKSPEINRSLRNFIEIYAPPKVLVVNKGLCDNIKYKKTDIAFVPAWYVV